MRYLRVIPEAGFYPGPIQGALRASPEPMFTIAAMWGTVGFELPRYRLLRVFVPSWVVA